MIRKFHPDKIPILLSRGRNSKLKQFDNSKYEYKITQHIDPQIFHGLQADNGD